MTSHLNSHRTIDIKPEMLSGVQNRNGTPHDKYNIGSITHYPCANKQKRLHFNAKTTSAKLYIYIGVGSLFIDEAHMALGIFPVFFPCMLPTSLCGIFYFSYLSIHKRINKKNHFIPFYLQLSIFWGGGAPGKKSTDN